jgi:DNA-binding transcriptional regulator YiaG
MIPHKRDSGKIIVLTTSLVLVILSLSQFNSHQTKIPQAEAEMTGATMRSLREAAGITQTALAAQIRSSQGYICKVEQARRVDNETAAKLVRGIETLRARNGARFEKLSEKVRLALSPAQTEPEAEAVPAEEAVA